MGDPEPCTGALELSCPRCGACSCPEDDQDDGTVSHPRGLRRGEHVAPPPAPPLPLFGAAP